MYVTVSKPTRIYNPWFTGIKWVDPSGYPRESRSYTAEIPKGSSYRTGPISNAYSDAEPEIMIEITEWKNPTYVHFEEHIIWGHSYWRGQDPANLFSAWFGGCLTGVHESITSRWVHNGEYYNRGRKINKPDISQALGTRGAVCEWRSYAFQSTGYLVSDFIGAPYGRSVITASLPNYASGFPISNPSRAPWPASYTYKVGSTNFLGLLRIDKYAAGGSTPVSANRYIVKCPLAFNVSQAELYIVSDWVSGKKFLPGEANNFGRAVLTSETWQGSKPLSNNQRTLVATGATDLNPTMMIGTNEDYWTYSNTLNASNRYECHKIIFRFEMPYGLE